MKKLLNPKEAAELLGVAEQTLTNWRCTKARDLPYVKFGKLIKYDPADLEAFIARSRRV